MKKLATQIQNIKGMKMADKIIRRSYMYMLWWLAMFAALFVFGTTLFYRGHTIAGTVLFIIALVSILMYLKASTDTRPRVTMDAEGISATEFKGVKILWGDIKKVDVIRFPRVGRIITFELYDEAKYASLLTEKQRVERNMNKTFGLTPFTIMTEGLDTPPAIIYEDIIKHIRDGSDQAPSQTLS
ncbi:MAG: hypothetical protein U0350_50325 [Caldilineaceae bacterium]